MAAQRKQRGGARCAVTAPAASTAREFAAFTGNAEHTSGNLQGKMALPRPHMCRWAAWSMATETRSPQMCVGVLILCYMNDQRNLPNRARGVNACGIAARPHSFDGAAPRRHDLSETGVTLLLDHAAGFLSNTRTPPNHCYKQTPITSAPYHCKRPLRSALSKHQSVERADAPRPTTTTRCNRPLPPQRLLEAQPGHPIIWLRHSRSQ